MSKFVEIIIAEDSKLRDTSLESVLEGIDLSDLRKECDALELFRHTSENLYEKVRALFFLYAIHRFAIPKFDSVSNSSIIPYEAHVSILNRSFEEGINILLQKQLECGSNLGLSSALAEAYKKLAFQTLADQVRKSVRSTKGNQWMFRTGHYSDHPLKFRGDLMVQDKTTGLYPILREETPVRMDISHSGWSDIFFLGMDYPEGANVINVSVNLSIYDQHEFLDPKPPIETYLRVIEEPVVRLTSIDLGATADIDKLSDVFDFAKDYLGLLKAGVIASGLIPPAMEGANFPIEALLSRLLGPGLGFEIVTKVNGIPKGSRLAVSTNLLASIISICMRASGQTISDEGVMIEKERRLVAARAILGEWIGGSGGGWQDSGGVWPGIKVINGVLAAHGDPEYGVSKGRLLPKHTNLGEEVVSKEVKRKLQDSLVLVHGGMAQDVGPILEMVTEKYLLRSDKEWSARNKAIEIYNTLVDKIKMGDIRGMAEYTQKNFDGPIQSIIPWAGNKYTEMIIQGVRQKFGADFWGFWMLGGMSGGGMGFIFDPKKKREGQNYLQDHMRSLKASNEFAIPFAMEPVVYNFSINEYGTKASFQRGNEALMPTGYYSITVPSILKKEMHSIPALKRRELELLGEATKSNSQYSTFVSTLFDRIIPQADTEDKKEQSLEHLLHENGFDPVFHNQLKFDLKHGRVGLAQNRLPINSKITDVLPEDVVDATNGSISQFEELGLESLKNGELAIVSLAGGAGSRWTNGAGVVKSLNPFARISGKHRNFIEAHLSKNQRMRESYGVNIDHIFTTSYLTHDAIHDALKREGNYGFEGNIHFSRGRVIGLRTIPMERDLRFEWEEMPQQLLDEQQQKMQDSLRSALIGWVKALGEGNDYRDNLPHQCVHPVGHWYEVPNLLLNGTLNELFQVNPNLKYLLVHNIDTLGVNADPSLLGMHIAGGKTLTTEVIARNIEDRGGGLARINGIPRIVEGLALPDEKVEFDLTYYNSSTTWVDIDQLLRVFDLERKELEDINSVVEKVRKMSNRIPTYVTIKSVKKRWGKGQEDVFPVTQFEKLWGDMTSLNEIDCQYVAVPRFRGQQLKEVDQLDSWLRDGSAEYLDQLCSWKS